MTTPSPVAALAEAIAKKIAADLGHAPTLVYVPEAMWTDVQDWIAKNFTLVADPNYARSNKFMGIKVVPCRSIEKIRFE